MRNLLLCEFGLPCGKHGDDLIMSDLPYCAVRCDLTLVGK